MGWRGDEGEEARKAPFEPTRLQFDKHFFKQPKLQLPFPADPLLAQLHAASVILSLGTICTLMCLQPHVFPLAEFLSFPFVSRFF